MEPKQHLHLGFYKTGHNWNLQQAVKPHYQLFLEILHAASNNAGLSNCVGARLARGAETLQQLQHYTDMPFGIGTLTFPILQHILQVHPATLLHFDDHVSESFLKDFT